MRKKIKICFILILLTFISCQPLYAFSTRHHLINIGKNLINIPLSVLRGIFIKGPKNVKEIYLYEVYGSDDPEKNNQLYKKLFAIWSAPVGESKGIIDGVVEGVGSGGEAIKNLLSIVASD